jgi:hypothetical protein
VLMSSDAERPLHAAMPCPKPARAAGGANSARTALRWLRLAQPPSSPYSRGDHHYGHGRCHCSARHATPVREGE